MIIHTHSEPGGHPENEDAFRAQPHPADAHCTLCVLADGQGGRAGGARASTLACDLVLSAAAKLSPADLALPSAWVNLLTIADAVVAKDSDAGFTTLIGLCVYRGYVVGAANGDSAVLMLNGPRSIELTAQQSKNPPIGSGNAAVTAFSCALDAATRLLVVSDGVWKYVGTERIAEEAAQARGDALIQSLLTAARLPGSGGLQDDFTIVVLEQ
jgi:serine/threonine protein phosphatase PrpC